MQRCITALFPDVWIGAMFEKHSDDPGMPACSRRLNWRYLHGIVGKCVHRRPGFDEVFCYIEMTEEAGQSQWLKTVFRIGVNQPWVSCQQADQIIAVSYTHLTLPT